MKIERQCIVYGGARLNWSLIAQACISAMKPRIVMKPTLLALVAPEVVVMTT